MGFFYSELAFNQITSLNVGSFNGLGILEGLFVVGSVMVIVAAMQQTLILKSIGINRLIASHSKQDAWG